MVKKPDEGRIFALPRDVPRAVERVVHAASYLMDADGEVVGGMKALHSLLRNGSESSTREAVVQAEAWGFLERLGPALGGRQRVFVVVNRLFSGGCANCGEPSRAGRHCAQCKQGLRADRSWMNKAIAMSLAGKTPYEIHVATGRPLYGDDPRDVGIINLLHRHGLCADSWLERRRKYFSGEGDAP